MEKEFTKLELSSVSSASEPRPVITEQRDPIQQALLNPVVLDAVFKHLRSDDYALCQCREVCSLWADVAKGFLFPNPPLKTYKIPEIGQNKEDSFSDDASSYDRISIAQFPRNRLRAFSDLAEHGLSEIKGLDQMSHVQFIMRTVRRGRDDDHLTNDYTRLTFLDAVKRASNLRVLDFWHWHYELSEYVADTLISLEELAGNRMLKETLESLSILDIRRKDIEALRAQNLKLKNLCVGINKADTSQSDLTPVLSLWLKDLNSSLECLSLHVNSLQGASKNVSKLEFPTEMKKLKILHIELPHLFGVDDIICLLQQLPNMESLCLMHAKSTGVKQVDYVTKSIDEFTYPSLRQLKVFVDEFEELDCPPYVYAPKLFPNLKKLSIAVYSRNTLLACMHTLKDMMIEELELNLLKLPSGFKTDVTTFIPWGSNVPSFNNWKKLRKLLLRSTLFGQDDHGVSIMTLYKMPFENILPKTLTSLELLDYPKLHWRKNVDFGFLLKLLPGLPRLMDFKLSNCIFYEGQRRIEESELAEKIENDPLTHPYLRLRFDPAPYAF